jgi:hypothetical protein
LARSDGIAIQAGDTRQQGNTTAALLLGEETDEQPSTAFVGTSDETVDGPVFLSDRAARCLAAGGTSAAMDVAIRALLRLDLHDFSLIRFQRANVILRFVR